MYHAVVLCVIRFNRVAFAVAVESSLCLLHPTDKHTQSIQQLSVILGRTRLDFQRRAEKLVGWLAVWLID